MDNNFSYENMSVAGTYTLKPAMGYLHTLTVNTTAAGTITIYDNASAASGKKIATLKSSIAEQTFIFDLEFSKGLTIVLAAASDVTVSFT